MATISLYLKDDVLRRLDAEVERLAKQDKAAGATGRGITTRSSYIERLIQDSLDATANLTQEVISYHVVSLAEEYGAEKVSLFGSFARGDATAESDVDILLEKGDIKGMKVLEFQDRLAEQLGRKVDVVTTAGASKRFLDKIRKDEVVLYAAG